MNAALESRSAPRPQAPVTKADRRRPWPPYEAASYFKSH